MVFCKQSVPKEGDSYDFETWDIGREIYQDTEFIAGGFEVVQQLCFMKSQKFPAAFQFNDDFIIQYQVGIIVADAVIFIIDLQFLLTFDLKAGRLKFHGQCIFIDFFKKTVAEISSYLDARFFDSVKFVFEKQVCHPSLSL